MSAPESARSGSDASVLIEDPMLALRQELDSLRLENEELRHDNLSLRAKLNKVGNVAENIFATTDTVYLDGFDISGKTEAAKHEASGDFYAFYPLPLGPRYLGIAVADVTDTG